MAYDKGSGTAIGGLSHGTAYFVRKSSTRPKIALFDTEGNALSGFDAGRINIQSGGSGTDHSLTVVFERKYTDTLKLREARVGELLSR